jgi:hypothetical protein
MVIYGRPVLVSFRALHEPLLSAFLPRRLCVAAGWRWKCCRVQPIYANLKTGVESKARGNQSGHAKIGWDQKVSVLHTLDHGRAVGSCTQGSRAPHISHKPPHTSVERRSFPDSMTRRLTAYTFPSLHAAPRKSGALRAAISAFEIQPSCQKGDDCESTYSPLPFPQRPCPSARSFPFAACPSSIASRTLRILVLERRAEPAVEGLP